MSKTVGECMTPNPVTITAELSLADAAERMHEHGVRHLPVIDRGQLVGIVSERDLALVMGIPGVDKRRVEVSEAMVVNPYVVEPSTPLADVVGTMRAGKIGTAVVVHDGELQGIFSVTDALAVLERMLEGE